MVLDSYVQSAMANVGREECFQKMQGWGHIPPWTKNVTFMAVTNNDDDNDDDDDDMHIYIAPYVVTTNQRRHLSEFNEVTGEPPGLPEN